MNSLLKLTNAPFEIEFNGKTYQIRKANLEQVGKFMERAAKYTDEKVPITVSWVRLVSYALYLVLSPIDQILTEEFISQNTPGNCNHVEVLTTLGFFTPVRTAPTQPETSTTEPSSPASPSAPDGPQAK